MLEALKVGRLLRFLEGWVKITGLRLFLLSIKELERVLESFHGFAITRLRLLLFFQELKDHTLIDALCLYIFDYFFGFLDDLEIFLLNNFVFFWFLLFIFI